MSAIRASAGRTGSVWRRKVLEHTGLVAVDEEAGDRDGREERLDDWDAGADARHDLPQALDLLVEQRGRGAHA
jgi:hypothetical protein